MNSRIASAIVLATAWSSVACTAIGYSVGSAIDRGNRPVRPPESFRKGEINTNRTIWLTLQNDSVLEGKFIGLQPLTPEQYRPSYERSRALLASSHRPPAIGDTVTLKLASGANVTVECLGFDIDMSSVEAAGDKWTHPIGFAGATDDGVTVIALNRIFDMTAADGSGVSPKSLDSLAARGAIPILSGVGFERPWGERRTIPFDEIRYVTVQSTAATTTGVTVGLVLDAIFVIGVITTAIACSPDGCFSN